MPGGLRGLSAMGGLSGLMGAGSSAPAGLVAGHTVNLIAAAGNILSTFNVADVSVFDSGNPEGDQRAMRWKNSDDTSARVDGEPDGDTHLDCLFHTLRYWGQCVTVGGRKAVKFQANDPGSPGSLSGTNGRVHSQHDTRNCTIHIVGKLNSAAFILSPDYGTRGFLCHGGQYAGIMYYLVAGPGQNIDGWAYSGSTQRRAYNVVSLADWHVFTWKGNGNNTVFRIDGAQVGAVMNQVDVGGQVSDFVFGNYSQAPADTDPCDHYMSQATLYTSALSDANCLANEQYLKSVWNTL